MTIIKIWQREHAWFLLLSFLGCCNLNVSWGFQLVILDLRLPLCGGVNIVLTADWCINALVLSRILYKVALI